MSEYRRQLEAWLGQLDIEAGTVYDIGGGQGSVLPRLNSHNIRNYKVLDLPEYDLGDEAFGFGNELYLKADVVFCLEVFEYLIDPVTALNHISFVLASGGKAYITFAFVYPHHNELDQDSLRYTEPGIKRLAQRAGLRVTDTWYRTDKSGLLEGFYRADGMKAAKQYPHHNVTGFIAELTK
jgi:SAM-dependent methyltransferase